MRRPKRRQRCKHHNKRIYKTPEAAYDAQRQLRKKFRAYYDWRCNSWHLTKG